MPRRRTDSVALARRARDTRINGEKTDALHRAGETACWIVISEEEARALQAGEVSESIKGQCRVLLETRP